MKVLVISDTHGNISHVEDILERTIPLGVKAVLHCGDYITDARIIGKRYPELEIYGVHGNCDIGFGAAYSEVVTLEGVNIFMTHGHRYSVKWEDYEDLYIDAVAHEAQLAICGHSHVAYLERREECTLLNPGSITQPRDGFGPSYAVLDLEGGKIKEISIMQIVDHQSVTRHPAMNKRNFY